MSCTSYRHVISICRMVHKRPLSDMVLSVPFVGRHGACAVEEGSIGNERRRLSVSMELGLVNLCIFLSTGRYHEYLCVLVCKACASEHSVTPH